MNAKLYVVLLIPALIIMFVFAALTPPRYWGFLAIIPVIFWILYYSINYVQKRKEKHYQNKDS